MHAVHPIQIERVRDVEALAWMARVIRTQEGAEKDSRTNCMWST